MKNKIDFCPAATFFGRRRIKKNRKKPTLEQAILDNDMVIRVILVTVDNKRTMMDKQRAVDYFGKQRVQELYLNEWSGDCFVKLHSIFES